MPKYSSTVVEIENVTLEKIQSRKKGKNLVPEKKCPCLTPSRIGLSPVRIAIASSSTLLSTTSVSNVATVGGFEQIHIHT